MTTQAVCEGLISTLADGSTSCSTGWLTTASTIPFNIDQIDPSVATGFFGAGFALFIVPWAAAWGCSQIFKLIR